MRKKQPCIEWSMCTDRRHPGPIRREAGAGDTEAVQSCKGLCVCVCVKDYYVQVQNKYIKVSIFRKKVTYYKCRKLSFTKLTMSAWAQSLFVQTNKSRINLPPLMYLSECGNKLQIAYSFRIQNVN